MIMRDLRDNDCIEDGAFTAQHREVDTPESASQVSAAPCTVGLQQNMSFFFEDTHVIFKVDDQHFRVHGYLFERESTEARALISRRNDYGDQIILLSDITVVEFENFLQVLYAPPLQEPPKMSPSGWTNVLKLSSLWNFAFLRSYAISKLSTCTDAIDRLVLAQTYSIDHWLYDAYMDVCERPGLPNDQDISKIGSATFIKIARAREIIGSQPWSNQMEKLRAIEDILELPRSGASAQPVASAQAYSLGIPSSEIQMSASPATKMPAKAPIIHATTRGFIAEPTRTLYNNAEISRTFRTRNAPNPFITNISSGGSTFGATEKATAETSYLDAICSPVLITSSVILVPSAVSTENEYETEVVKSNVKQLLERLKTEDFDLVPNQIIAWANRSKQETDGRTLKLVIMLLIEKAVDEAVWSQLYACLCRKMMERISSDITDKQTKNWEGKPLTGGQLFRRHLLNLCQEEFERGWVRKEEEARRDEMEENSEQERGIELHSEEHDVLRKTRHQGLGLIKFIGELFKLQMLTERIMHECVKKLLNNVENPEEDEIESLCKLLTTVGKLLDTQRGGPYMDIYFTRMRNMAMNPNFSSSIKLVLLDILELRNRKWIPRN